MKLINIKNGVNLYKPFINKSFYQDNHIGANKTNIFYNWIFSLVAVYIILIFYFQKAIISNFIK